MFYYAQLNENNICVGISSLKGEVHTENMVRIQEYSEDYFWRKHENGVWSTEKFLPDYGQIELDRMEVVEQAIAELSILLAGGAV
jgi:1-aminocyclopropane-1-carboxylate deaminase/D-cysteine desulfhydrase-like pyridoxal-dependent ACC family enzyme